MLPAQRGPALRPRAGAGQPLDQLLGTSDPGPATGAPGAASGGPRVTGVSLDSRHVVTGDLYVGLPGREHHGARFAADAVEAGAVAVLTDAAGAELATGLSVPVRVVEDPRRTMAAVAAGVYGRPGEALTLYGITGTNGKTTTAYLLEAGLRAVGHRVGLVGTIGFALDGVPLAAARTTVTTPEAPDLQALLAVMVQEGADSCVMEVSSHALVLGRVDAVTFDVAAFTGLGRDHLDFHRDEESYFEAKALLFTPERSRAAVVSVDDERGRQLVRRLVGAGRAVATVSTRDAGADYAVRDWSVGADGQSVVSLRTPHGPLDFRLGLPGEFNVRNAVTALAMLELSGVDPAQAAVGLAGARVPGRMQRVELGAGAPLVYVDFAHTPQAVAAALAAVAGRRRVVVLGCGGDRDPEKRGPMGAAAARAAAVVVVTDDNPRSEEPAAIRRQVLDGARTARDAEHLGCEVLDGQDRRAAIRLALARARDADVLLVLGKGHETGQEVAGTMTPFSDVEVLQQEWSGLLATSGGRS